MSQASLPQEGTARRCRSNHRATVRYRCAPATIGKVYLGDDTELQHAWVLNLSATGVGLTLARPLPIGTPIVVQMRGNDAATLYEITGHVVHCTAYPQDEWMLGCEFSDPLAGADLDNLL